MLCHLYFHSVEVFPFTFTFLLKVRGITYFLDPSSLLSIFMGSLLQSYCDYCFGCIALIFIWWPYFCRGCSLFLHRPLAFVYPNTCILAPFVLIKNKYWPLILVFIIWALCNCLTYFLNYFLCFIFNFQSRHTFCYSSLYVWFVFSLLQILWDKKALLCWVESRHTFTEIALFIVSSYLFIALVS